MRRSILGAVAALLALLASLTVVVPAQAIVGGSDAVVTDGTVSIWTDVPYRNRCTGVVVADRWVVTAAHCKTVLTDPSVGRVEIRIGLDNSVPKSAEHPKGYVSYGVLSYHWPDDFDPNTLVGDVMLMKTNRKVTDVKAMKLGGPMPNGTVHQIQGYGWVCDGPPGQSCSTWYAGPLQRMSAKSVPDSSCSFLADTVKQMCFADGVGTDSMACLGDSGAPQYTKGLGDDRMLRAVVSGDGDDNFTSCLQGPNGVPGVGLATEVGPYRSWMAGVMAGLPQRSTMPAAPVSGNALVG